MRDVMVVCKKCGNKAPASSMTLDIDEGLMVCQNCIKNKKIKKEIEKEIFHKREGSKAVKEEIPQKVPHKCKYCSYKFMVNPETKVPRNCPYCNKAINFGGI
ncbi:hypothetical protein HYU50_01315 [Candidatus Woesearchaeota archaeon]|nr:hypothetical protein [Candidatus Woesearchaeota archaeon]